MLRFVPFVLPFAMRFALPFALSVATLSGCVGRADPIAGCAREGDWLMTFTLAPGSDPLCEPLAPEHVGVAEEQIYARDCSADCTCDTEPGAACSGALSQTCSTSSTSTSLYCTYDLGAESASGTCTVAVTGDVALSCRYGFAAHYVGPVQ
jgi:hypothetical protein